MLILPGRPTAADVETLLTRLHAGPTDQGLRLPKRLRADELGTNAAALQVVCTWARRNTQASLSLAVDTIDELPDLLAQDHNLVGALMAPSVLDRDGVAIDRATRAAAIRRLGKLDTWAGAKRGNRAMFVAADHTLRSRPTELYYFDNNFDPHDTEGWKVRPPAGFRLLVERLLTLSPLNRRNQQPPLDRDVLSLAQFLYESYSNTHRWGRSSEAGVWLSPGVRLVRARGITERIDVLLAHASSDAPLAAYLATDHHGASAKSATAGSARRARFVELSILDCGPGLAARRLHELGITEPTVDEEYEAIRECMRFGYSSSGDQGYGEGLHHAQLALTSMGGYLSVRTGRLKLVRDYLSHPYRDANATSEPWLGRPLVEPGRSATGRADGTLVTVLLPVHYRAREDVDV